MHWHLLKDRHLRCLRTNPQLQRPMGGYELGDRSTCSPSTHVVSLSPLKRPRPASNSPCYNTDNQRPRTEAPHSPAGSTSPSPGAEGESPSPPSPPQKQAAGGGKVGERESGLQMLNAGRTP